MLSNPSQCSPCKVVFLLLLHMHSSAAFSVTSSEYDIVYHAHKLCIINIEGNNEVCHTVANNDYMNYFKVDTTDFCTL